VRWARQHVVDAILPMLDDLIDKLRSNSLHTRYGAVMALRRVGASMVAPLLPIVNSPFEGGYTRLAALEAVKPFCMCISRPGLDAFCAILRTSCYASLKIELIKVLVVRRHVHAIPSLQLCRTDESVDDRRSLNSWSREDERVSGHAQNAIQALERFLTSEDVRWMYQSEETQWIYETEVHTCQAKDHWSEVYGG